MLFVRSLVARIRPQHALSFKIAFPFCTEATTTTPTYIQTPTSSRWTFKHFAQIQARAERKRFLDSQVLSRSKYVVDAVPRKTEDTVISLKNKGLCPVFIEARSGFPELQLVASGKPIRAFNRRLKNYISPIYIRLEGEEIKCLITDIKEHHEGFMQRVTLSRYIEGEPNLVSVPVTVTHFTENHFVQKGYEFRTGFENVDLVCYNAEYPTVIPIDISYITPERPYKLADLANTFPPGLELAPTMDPMRKLVYFTPFAEASPEELEERLNQQLQNQKKKAAAGKEAAKAAASKGGDAKKEEKK